MSTHTAVAAFCGPFTVDQRAVLDELPDGILLTDCAGNIYDMNRAFCAMLERTRAELVGTHISSHVDTAELKQRPARLQQFLDDGIMRSHRTFKRKSGDVFCAEYHARKVNDHYAVTVLRECRPVRLEP